MILSIYFLSALFLIIGWFYYSRPQKIQAVNNFFRNKVFNDQYIVTKRKKISTFFFFLAVFCYMFAFVYSAEQAGKKDFTGSKAEIRREILTDAASFYTKIIAEKPDNISALTKIAYVFEEMGEKNRYDKTQSKIDALKKKNAKLQED